MVATALCCAGIAAACGVSRAETYTFQGTEWDNEEVQAGELQLEPNAVYVATCRMRHFTERNVSGSLSISVDGYGMGWSPIGNNHAQIDFAEAFLTASDTKTGPVNCTLRRWHVPGKSEISDVSVRRAVPSYFRTPDGLSLGHGESIDGHDYHFGTKFTEACHGHSRPMESFRSLRPGSLTYFGKGSEMRFVHELAGRKFSGLAVLPNRVRFPQRSLPMDRVT